MDNYLLIDNHQLESNENILLLTEKSDKIIIQQYSGRNTENFKLITTKHTLILSLFKLNRVWYININGYNILDYKQFVRFHKIETSNENTIKIYNNYTGDLSIPNCNIALFQKGIKIISNWMKYSHPNSLWNDFMYFFFHS
jgi:hypothetical protein